MQSKFFFSKKQLTWITRLINWRIARWPTHEVHIHNVIIEEKRLTWIFGRLKGRFVWNDTTKEKGGSKEKVRGNFKKWLNLGEKIVALFNTFEELDYSETFK